MENFKVIWTNIESESLKDLISDLEKKTLVASLVDESDEGGSGSGVDESGSGGGIQGQTKTPESEAAENKARIEEAREHREMRKQKKMKNEKNLTLKMWNKEDTLNNDIQALALYKPFWKKIYILKQYIILFTSDDEQEAIDFAMQYKKKAGVIDRKLMFQETVYKNY